MPGKPKRLNWRKTLKESVNMCVYRRAEANFDDLNPTRLMESSNLLEDRFPLIFFLFDGIWRRRRFCVCLVCFTV